MTSRDAINVIAGALVAVLATGFYNCLFYYQQSKWAEYWYAFWGTIGTLILFLVYLFLFFYIFKERKNQKPPISTTLAEPKNNEREFQFQMFEVQRDYETANTILSAIIAIGFSLAIALVAVSFTSLSQQLKTNLLYGALSSMAIGTFSIVVFVIYHNVMLQKRVLGIHKDFIDDYLLESSENRILKALLDEQKKTNEYLRNQNHCQKKSKSAESPDEI
ncbi:MAG: hypothetical protein NWF05_00405 [Candidatus Bathyarchaeota archaeon]|nr:hypothetical protein [Candidatus Bathyarchaeota archaeon]